MRSENFFKKISTPNGNLGAKQTYESIKLPFPYKGKRNFKAVYLKLNKWNDDDGVLFSDAHRECYYDELKQIIVLLFHMVIFSKDGPLEKIKLDIDNVEYDLSQAVTLSEKIGFENPEYEWANFSRITINNSIKVSLNSNAIDLVAYIGGRRRVIGNILIK